MPRIRILPYAPYSKSAKLLAFALGAKLLKPEATSSYKARESDVVINWGNTRESHRATLNGCEECLQTATNKLTFFQQFDGRDWLPKFWTDPEDIDDEDFPVLARTVLNGHSGVGIVVCSTRDALVPAPLYVKYISKKEEYRVHVGKLSDDTTTIIAVQQKKRRLDYENPDWKIRNHANGFVYAREGVDPPVGVLSVSTDCLLRSGLDFGACDVIWNESQQKAYVLEINTAPGLEGQTLDDYVNYFTQIVYENSS